jgi:hypothetical protein
MATSLPPLPQAPSPPAPEAAFASSSKNPGLEPPSSHSLWTSIKPFLGRHPILCLALLSPGIPEYLSSSSPLTTLLASPPFFFLQLAGNLGLYLPGVLLIREAMVRWKKGWGSVLLLGAAYGILEEGIALETLFYSKAGPVGVQGYYGHWLGVSWVWTAGILFVHMIFSIALPILLLGLALPQTRGTSLVGPTGIAIAFVVWAIDIPVLMAVVHTIYHYWMGWPIFFATFAAIGLLVFAAYTASAEVLPTRVGRPTVTPFRAGLLGLAFFLPLIFLEALLAAGRVLPALAILVMEAYAAILGLLVLRTVGTVGNGRQLVALAAGLLASIALIGFIAELPIPVTAVADVATCWFLWHLWRKYPTPISPSSVAVPPGAAAST